MFHVELVPLGGTFGPLKSDLGVFWPFRETDYIMEKNKNANFSKSPHGPIFKFCVVIREAILQKMAPILDPVNFFSVLTLLADCVLDHFESLESLLLAQSFNLLKTRTTRKVIYMTVLFLAFFFSMKLIKVRDKGCLVPSCTRGQLLIASIFTNP